MTVMRSLDEAHALGLEKSPLDPPRAYAASDSFPAQEQIPKEEGDRDCTTGS